SDRVLVGIVASPDVFPDLDKQRVDASERRCRNDFVDVIRGQLLAIAAKIEKTLQLSALGLQKPRFDDAPGPGMQIFRVLVIGTSGDDGIIHQITVAADLPINW